MPEIISNPSHWSGSPVVTSQMQSTPLRLTAP